MNKKLILGGVILVSFILYFSFSSDDVIKDKKGNIVKVDKKLIKTIEKKEFQKKWQETVNSSTQQKKEFWQKLNSYELEKFIKAGVYVKVRDSDKLTPLHFAAAYSQDIDVISLLVRTGAKINAKGLYDATPLHYAAAFNSDADIIKQLIKLKANVDAKDKELRTPLHWIVKFAQNVEVIDTLLNSKIKINLKDGYGHTALDIVKNNKELSKDNREKVMR